MSDNDKNTENNEYEDMNYNNNINSNYNSDNNEKNERYIQTNEDKDEYILELQNKLKLKDAYITQLENDYYDKKIKCDCKEELDFIFSNAKDDRIEFLEEKISSMKKLVQDLKLQYLKLHEENENNTKILANILKLDNSVLKSKEKILEKIKQSKLGQEKEIIMDSMNIIDLKLELNEKKSILKSKEYEYNILKENSKYKNFIEMKKQLTNNSGIKNEIISDLEKDNHQME